jgi:nicotinamidase-related amidase
MLKQKNLFVIGTPSAEFHGAIARSEELVIRKQRVCAFSENQLHMILRARGIETLVFFGSTLSGKVPFEISQ